MSCDSIWDGRDFSKCFQERCVIPIFIPLVNLLMVIVGRYLKAVIPLIYIGASLCILLLTYTYSSLRSYYRNYKLRSTTAKLLATTDEEYDSEEEAVVEEDSDGNNSESTLIDSLPQHTKISIVEDRPAYERVWVAAEIGLLTGEVVLSIFSIIKGDGGRSIAVAGHIQWIYLLIIALLRFMGTQRTRSLWTHSMLIYLFSWPIAFLLLRSAIIGRQNLDLGVAIANVCLITGLCGLVLTSRAGNKPVKLVSTNGLEPSRVNLCRLPLTVGTDRQSLLPRNIQLGRSNHCKRMVAYFYNWRRLGSQGRRSSTNSPQSISQRQSNNVRCL